MIKPGVDVRGMQPQMVLAFAIAQQVYAAYAAECVITSCSDGKHGPKSLHYKGMALDLRTNNLRSDLVHPVYIKLKTALGAQFDVVLEADHLHVEFDPKEPEKQDD